MAIKVKQAHTSNEGFRDPSTNVKGTGGLIKKVIASNCGGGNGTIVSVGNWRADRQNSTVTHSNIQIQRNDVRGQDSSIAGVLVAKALIEDIGQVNSQDKEQRTRAKSRLAELTRAIQGGLSKSVGSWKVTQKGQIITAKFTFYVVEGTFSS